MEFQMKFSDSGKTSSESSAKSAELAMDMAYSGGEILPMRVSIDVFVRICVQRK